MTFNDFFSELFKRWFAKKPNFFIKLQNIALVLTALTAIPAFLQSYGVELELPQWALIISSLISATAAFISQLTVTTTDKERLGISS
ncbi:MAG: hypothetical protein KBH21_00460 [Acetoanaerobium sp.]|nr:hypothetical protein [Acetoanaerobium sp.]